MRVEIDALQREFEFTVAKFIAGPEVTSGLRLGSSAEPPAADVEIDAWWGSELPPELRALWHCCAEAQLFRDLDYGQWGLHLLSPASSRARTRDAADQRRGMRGSDIVVGEFLGDQDLLVLDPTETGERRLLISLPLDERVEWYSVGPDVIGFLRRFYEADGKKYWVVGLTSG